MHFIKPRSYVSIVILLLALPLIAMEDSSSLLRDAKRGRLTETKDIGPKNPKSLINICCKKICDQRIQDQQTGADSSWLNAELPDELQELLKHRLNLALWKAHAKEVAPSLFLQKYGSPMVLSKDGTLIIAKSCKEITPVHPTTGGALGELFSLMQAQTQRDRTIAICDAKTGQCIRELPVVARSGICSLAISEDNNVIVVGSWDNSAYVYTVATDDYIELKGHAGWVETVAISPDNSFVITGSKDGTARKWDRQTGKCVGQLIENSRWIKQVALEREKRAQGVARNSAIDAVAISKDSRLIITSSNRLGTTCIWDAQTDDLITRIVGNKNEMSRLAISPDNSFVVTGSFFTQPCLWDAKTGERMLQLDEEIIYNSQVAHVNGINSIALSSDGNYMVTGWSFGPKMLLWDIKLGKCVAQFDYPSTENPESVAINFYGTDIFLATKNNVYKWSVAEFGNFPSPSKQ